LQAKVFCNVSNAPNLFFLIPDPIDAYGALFSAPAVTLS